jgi:hypothetical protein
MTTDTAKALALIAAGKTVRQAAREVDISESAVHAALRKSKATEQCPCCGSMVEPGRIKEKQNG